MSLELEISPYHGLGPLRFGMARAEVRQLLGAAVRSFKKSPSSVAEADAFDELGIHVHYDGSYHCEAIEVATPSNPLFRGKRLLGVPLAELKDWFRSVDAGAEEDDSGLTSLALGIALYAPFAAKSLDALVESVIVFRRGYYD